MTTRDFIGYGPVPPRFEWPDKSRVALNFVLNYEEGAERNALDGDSEIEGFSEAPYPPNPDRELSTESIYEYGSRVGVWRLMNLFDSYQAPLTIFACGLALERNPPASEAFVTRGYDFVGHGHKWISHFGLTEAQEREQIVAGRDAIEAATGRRVTGWFTRPPFTSATRRLVAEAGIPFDSNALNDDVPYFTNVEGRPFLVVPYSQDVNDGRFWRNGFFTGQDFERYCVDTFDVLYAESEPSPRMMTVGLHARIIGRPGRIAGLERFLAYARGHGGAWITTRTEIARFWMDAFAPPETWNRGALMEALPHLERS